MSSSSVSIKKSSSSSSNSALASCWIKRLSPSQPLPPPPPSHVTSIPFPRFLPHLHHQERVVVVESPDLGFGPFRVRPRNAPLLSPLFRYRRQLTSGILGNNTEKRGEKELRVGYESIDPFPSQLPADRPPAAAASSAPRNKKYDSRRGGRGADDHSVSAARRDLFHPHAFGLSTVRNLTQQQSCCLPSDAEEPFSYWNMGRLEGGDFVSSIRPMVSSTISLSRKRTANAYGFFPSKYKRVRSEG